MKFGAVPTEESLGAILAHSLRVGGQKLRKGIVLTPEHLAPLARALKPGAEFRVATDIADYVRQTLQEVPKLGFQWMAERPSDWREPWNDWLSTRYEQKALREGRVPHYLTFRR